jgi:hypothetical protein
MPRDAGVRKIALEKQLFFRPITLDGIDGVEVAASEVGKGCPRIKNESVVAWAASHEVLACGTMETRAASRLFAIWLISSSICY